MRTTDEMQSKLDINNYSFKLQVFFANIKNTKCKYGTAKHSPFQRQTYACILYGDLVHIRS